MGYIQNLELVAFLTQKGKKYFFSNTKERTRITFFSPADPDTDYIVASSTTTGFSRNILPEFFVPNLSGISQLNSCFRYLSDGISQKYGLDGGDCDTVGAYLDSDGNVTCIRPNEPILFIKTQNFSDFGGFMTGISVDYTNENT